MYYIYYILHCEYIFTILNNIKIYNILMRLCMIYIYYSTNPILLYYILVYTDLLHACTKYQAIHSSHSSCGRSGVRLYSGHCILHTELSFIWYTNSLFIYIINMSLCNNWPEVGINVIFCQCYNDFSLQVQQKLSIMYHE